MTRLSTAAALVEVQISQLTPPGQPPVDDHAAIAAEMLEFLTAIPTGFADVIGGVLDDLERSNLAGRSVTEREQQLTGLWSDAAWRGRLSLLTRLAWLVIYSRPPARRLVGFRDPRTFAPGDPTVHVPQPPVPPM